MEKQMGKTGNIVLLAAAIAAALLGASCAAPGNATLKAATSTPFSPTPASKTSRERPTAEYLAEANQLTTLESVKLSKWVVLVKSISSEVREMPDKNIFTFSDFEVLESVKGDYPDKTLTLRVVGGRFGGVEVTKAFDTEFVANLKYVLFLGDKNTFGYPTINPQSIFTVETNRETNSEFVSPKPSLPLYDAKTGEPYTKKLPQIPLEDFLYSIKKVK
jgi:hypothetical protein